MDKAGGSGFPCEEDRLQDRLADLPERRRSRCEHHPEAEPQSLEAALLLRGEEREGDKDSGLPRRAALLQATLRPKPDLAAHLCQRLQGHRNLRACLRSRPLPGRREFRQFEPQTALSPQELERKVRGRALWSQV